MKSFLFLEMNWIIKTYYFVQVNKKDNDFVMTFAAHGEAERVQVTLFSYYNNDICALVTSPFVFDHNPTYFLACFLVESVYNIASLEDLELIKSDRFDLGEEDLDTLDQRLYLALRYLEIPEWWHLLGPNSPAGKH